MCTQLLKALRMGQDWGHGDRFKSAYSASFHQAPSLNGLVKDHKETLKLRPVCRAQASQSPNGPLADLVCELLSPFIEAADSEERSEVISTEELCNEVEEVNKEIMRTGERRGPYQLAGSTVVGSCDVSAFYPSIDVEVAAEEVKQEIIESKVDIEGLDIGEVALYLACSMTQEEIDQEGLTNVVHKRRHNRGARPGLTCKAITGGAEVRAKDDSWLPPGRMPGCRQKRRMVGCMAKAACLLVMKNHFFSFNNVIMKQRQGGAIGNSLTERLGRLLMKRFFKRFKVKMKKLQIETMLAKNYVDDVTDVLVALDPGVRFDKDANKMVKVEELVEADQLVPEDARTMEELRKISNTVFECLQFTTDCPSSHQAAMVPVLDLQMFVEDGIVKYHFYEKPCASKLVIPESSAHSKKMKMSVLVEEGVRRMRNCSRRLGDSDWRVRTKILEGWSMKLRRSGYPATTRHQVVKAAVERWEGMCKVEDEGGRPVHRAREWQKAARRLDKEMKVVRWHQGREGQVSAPLIIDPTSGEMTKKMKEACTKFEEETGIRVAVRERAGRKVKSDCKAEPLRALHCGRADCFCCSTGNPGGCERNSVGYRMSCDTCLLAGVLALYDGETGRNAYARGGEHQGDLRHEREESPLWKHCQLVHGGEAQPFSMKVLRSFQSCLERQVNEAVRISNTEAEHILNSRSEFHQAPIIRQVVVHGLEAEQGEEEAGGRGAGWGADRGARGAGRGRGRRAQGTG